MRAVWRAARAAVRRRRVQTLVIGVVVMLSTASIVVALGLLQAASAPFDRGFAQQRGAHAVAAFDTAEVSKEALAATARRPGVEAAAGPFPQAVLDVPEGVSRMVRGPQNVVGRADPAGPVDRVDLWSGRWATAPGEIVLHRLPPAESPLPFGHKEDPLPLGEVLQVPGKPALTVVGYAYSLNKTADAWVSPEQIEALKPVSAQMLYRFADAATDAEVDAGVARAGEGLPEGAFLGSHSYLVTKREVASALGVYVPFLMVFGVLGLTAAVLIVANVVSGAVVSGFRHIGMLKALGFTPREVVGVYLLMVSVPAVAACLLGTLVGNLAARPLLIDAFRGMGLGDTSVGPLVNAAALLGMPAIVLLAAYVPARRARRLSAAEAISAGSAPRSGHGLRVQRRLGGTRLPRPVSLGLGLPFTRPGRTALTLAAIVVGVTTVTFATGLVATVGQYADVSAHKGAVQVAVERGDPMAGVASEEGDAQTARMLKALPGTTEVTARLSMTLSLVGSTRSVDGHFFRGDSSGLGFQREIVQGRWLDGPGEVVVPSVFLKERGLEVGDRVTLEKDGRHTRVTVVGATMSGDPSALFADWGTAAPLEPRYQPIQVAYLVKLAAGTDVDGYLEAVRAADSGLVPKDLTSTVNGFALTVTGLATALTLMLGTVAALGVFNTVVLNTRDRRRDLGMLKSIGMTPRQVMVMMLTSMAVLGLAGGLVGIPLGVVAHRLIVPLAVEAANMDIPAFLMDVWQAPELAALAFTGAVLALLGAFVPSRSAARLTISEALRNE
ncbi:FtsX-like permease family protein [Streptomyces coeruleoprunus]|uniref:FtsX-like permease family protein n=1 Tax=Streptomyces coeruleoprunus TaxID=285563 RepID=A0ABV9XID5_9ACTN